MKKLVLLALIAVGLSGIFAPVARAISLSINVGDQPYYSHGPRYWDGRVYYLWVPGHFTWRNHHKVWVHGHYRVQ